MFEKVVIFGKGKVGMATDLTLKTNADFHDPLKGFVIEDFTLYDCAIICVSSLLNGPHDHNDIIKCLQTLEQVDFAGTVVIRCTVSPVFLRTVEVQFPRLNIIHFPEFMKQEDDHYMDTPWILVLGGDMRYTRPFGAWLVSQGYGDMHMLHFCTVEESALIKLNQNAGLALKVVYANIIYEMCQQYGADYEIVRKGVTADWRVGPGHMQVPGGHGFGFAGHCLPKDIRCLDSVGYNRGLWKKIIEINEQLKVKNV